MAIENDKGFFTYFYFDQVDGWTTLLNFLSPNLDAGGMERLKVALDGICKAIIIEKHYIDKDYRDTFTNFYSKRFNTPNSRCIRLHFFSSIIDDNDQKDANVIESINYLGYSVIRPTKPNCIGRTFLSCILRQHHNSHIAVCEEKVYIAGKKFIIKGFPFISQDADATVCAQSALWMLFRYFSNKYQNYAEIYPSQITNLANNFPTGHRIYPTSGLSGWQLAEILRLQKFYPITHDKSSVGDDVFFHLLYTYVESGIPLLLTTNNHVVVCYGHCSDFSLQYINTSKFKYTSYFNKQFIINDDNYHPYQSLPLPQSQSFTNYSVINWDNVTSFIVPLPEKVFLDAKEAQILFEKLIEKFNFDNFSEILKNKDVIYRLFLTSSRSYKNKISTRGMGNKYVADIYRNLPMPHFIWICEIADIDEYRTTKQILGEIIWDATCNPHEPEGWIALHYPEVILVNIGVSLNQNPDMRKIALTCHSSYPLYTSNLHT